MNKVIFLIDIDAFFAQAEEIRNPEYKGKSIVVGHFMNGRGVITTGNYKVRELMGGSVSGMPYHKVKRVISDLIIVEPDYEYYSELTESLAQILKSYCTELEPSSIDEYYLDVTKIAHKYSSVENLADKIRIRILKELNLTVSIGVSDNKILAKMASSMNKPFGTTILFKDSLKTKL
ncbi:MAG: hypothetical protein DRP42_00885 [Tenericutes bacterium]|nr:MAG: hypothetical protein DRP42_00885 [Mycoplasmatota bacterium]